MKWFGVLLLVKTVYSASHNPDENLGINDPNLFEGDMILPKDQIRRAERGEDIDTSRKRGSSTFRLWPNGVVSYVIHSSLGRNSRAVSAVKAGMAEWTAKTCIRFKKRTNERAYVLFRSGAGCASSVGRTGSRQNIYLDSGCWTKGVVGHEIGHAVGFYHEQSRPDRDKYITVIFGNIRSGAARNFHKYPSFIDSLGTRYDYGSLMHYGSKAFSRNGRPTIVAKRPGAEIGQRRGLSSIDTHQANLLYKAQCERRGEGKGTVYFKPKQSSFRGCLQQYPWNMCSNYKVLSSADRSQENTAQSNVRCDQRDLPTVSGWYRFMGAAGNQIADRCVPAKRCGTHATGWLSGNHPTVEEGVVTRKVCYSWLDNCCRFSNNIRVKNCDNYFVYELHWPLGCSLRYCGKKGPEPTTKPPTTTESCKDRSRTCAFWEPFCNIGIFEFVKTLCNKTCRVC